MVSYHLFGYGRAKSRHPDSSSAALSYLEELHRLKGCGRRPMEAAAMVRRGFFPIHVVPGEARNHPEARELVFFFIASEASSHIIHNINMC